MMTLLSSVFEVANSRLQFSHLSNLVVSEFDSVIFPGHGPLKARMAWIDLLDGNASGGHSFILTLGHGMGFQLISL